MADMILKKKPMTREQFLERQAGAGSLSARVQEDPMRLVYHIQPPMGWLNDPNGLCQKDGVYHIYHQFVPFYPELCSVLWGHVTTEDFIHYEYHEPAVYPDSPWDENGAYSGSVFQKDGRMYVYYTGNVRHRDQDYDYINEGREQNTLLMTSRDGFHFSKKQLLMKNTDYPADLSLHVRDSQVFSENGRYYMIQGARDRKDHGSVLLFESENLMDWNYKLRFEPETPFGYMWECPNYLKVDGSQFLIACPQGIEAKGLDYASMNQCGYFPLQYDFKGMEYVLGDFRQLDRGFDFYAPQVFQDESGRWLLFGWMSTPDADYDCERTMEYGWVHAMTVPRELYVNGKGRLCQRPARELKSMRRDGEDICFQRSFTRPVPACFELKLRPEKPFTLQFRESAFLKFADGVLSLDLTGCGGGRMIRGVNVREVWEIRILSDTSSVEIFINGGEEVFTSRIYDSMQELKVSFDAGQSGGQAGLWRLN